MRVKISTAVFALAVLLSCLIGLTACYYTDRSYKTVSDGVLRYGGYIYADSDGEYSSGDFTAESFIGEPTEIIIPEEIEGYSVTAVSSTAFRDCKSLESVTFSAKITRIPAEAFTGCVNLASIKIAEGNPVYRSEGNCIISRDTNTVLFGCKNSTIPEGVKSIGRRAFAECANLTEIVIPASVTAISESAFYNCAGLESAEILGAEEIGQSAFYGCENLKQTVLPDGLTAIGERAFAGCISLTEIILPESVERIESFAFANCKNLTNAEIPDGALQIGEGVLNGCADLQSITVPFAQMYPNTSEIKVLGYFFGTDRYEGGVKVEQWESFADFGNSREYKSYYIPSSLQSVTVSGENLPDTAFNYCAQIEEIRVGQNVTRIGVCSFYGCAGLKSLIIENGEAEISKDALNLCYAFYDCSALEYAELPAEAFEFVESFNLKEVKINGGQAIADSSFKDCVNLESVSIAESVNHIGDGAFSHCSSLTELTIPAGVADVGMYAFGNCASLETVYWNPTECSVGNMPFTQCASLEQVIFGESVKVIPDKLLYFCSSLNEVVIPDWVEEIGEETFFGCSGLKVIYIPASVTVIGDDAFKYCTGLEEVCISDVTAWCGIDFKGDYSNPLYLAKNLSLGGERIVDLVLPEGITEIGKDAFICCEGIRSVTLPSSLTFIGDSAFWYCNGLERVYISDFTAWCGMEMRSNPLAYASEGLFLNGERLSGDFTVEEGITQIPSYTFMYSTIKNVTLPKSLTYVGQYAFLFCNELDGVCISDFTAWCGIKFFNSNPMGMANRLYLNGKILSGEFTVPDGVEVIPYGTFKGSEVTSVILPDGLREVEQQAFRDCVTLKEIIIPASVEEISPLAFLRCYNLISVYFGGTREAWEKFGVEFYSDDTTIYFYSE